MLYMHMIMRSNCLGEWTYFVNQQQLCLEISPWLGPICLLPWKFWKHSNKHRENGKTLPREHLISCQGVKMLFLLDKLRFVLIKVVTIWVFFYFCHILSFVTIWAFYFVTFWVLSQFELLSFVTFWGIEFFLHNLSFVTIWVFDLLSFVTYWVFEFHHNFKFWVSPQFEFLSVMTIWVFGFLHN